MSRWDTHAAVKESIDDAWNKLASRLANLTPHPHWEAWERERPAVDGPVLSQGAADEKPASAAETVSRERPRSVRIRALLFRPDVRRLARRFAFAAVCGCAIAWAITPAGSDALAALLQKFRMQEPTIVREQDLEQLFRTMFPDGSTREAVNRLGTFSRTTGESRGAVTLKEAERLLGVDLPEPTGFDVQTDRVYLSPAETLTFRLHVDEINRVLRRLGAKTLLPESVDDKPIRLEIGESVSINWKELAEGRRESWYMLLVQPIPTVDVDPSVPVEEAWKAVVQFPLLPDELRRSLQKTALSEGRAPLPLVTRGDVEKIDVDGVELWIESNPLQSEHGENRDYNVFWIRDGHLFMLDGGLPSKDDMVAKARELIGR